MSSFRFGRLALRIAFVGLFQCFAAFGLNPFQHITQYSHSAWRVEDGSVAGPANAIVQGSDGYIWIGTEAGLYRFDGIRFTAFPDGPAGIQTMYFDRSGKLWLGTQSGLIGFDHGTFKAYPQIRGWINQMATDSNGNIWFTRTRAQPANAPLCEIEDENVRCFGANGTIPFAYAQAIAIDARGTFWISNNDGIIRRKDGTFTSFAIGALRSGKNLEGVSAILPLPDGSLLVGMARSGPHLGLQQFAEGRFRPFPALGRNATRMLVEVLFLDRGGAIWIGTLGQGIYRVIGDRVEHFDRSDGLSGDTISGMFEDTEGNLWVGTTEGVDCFRNKRVTTFSSREGLGNDRAQSVLASRDGRIWIGNAVSLDQIRNGSPSVLGSSAGLPGLRVTALVEDRHGRLLLGIDNDLYIYDHKKFARIRGQDGSSVGLVINLAEDVDGDIWAIRARRQTLELVRFRNDVLVEIIPLTVQPRILATNPAGGIVVCFQDETCARSESGKLARFDKKPGLVDAVEVEGDGSAWVATKTSIYWNHNTTASLTKQNGLPCNGAYALQFDRAHDLWSYSKCGLIQIPSSEIKRWKADSTVRVKTELFDRMSGAMPNKANFSPASTVSADGKIWFANGYGVQMIDPMENTNSDPVPVRIESLIADRKPIRLTQDIRIPPRPRELEIDYTGLSFVAPHKVKFRYALAGQDGSWQDVETRRQVFFSDLSPGKYTFRVIASRDGETWNGPTATISFVVLAAWYQTAWFRLLLIVLILLAVWLIYTYRMRKLAAAMRLRFDERLAERTRLARDLHDSLLQTIQGSKMVADDALDAPADEKRLKPAMETLSKWLGQAVHQGREALNSLHASSTETNDLADAFRRCIEDCLLFTSINTEVHVHGEPKDMHPVVRDEVYRIGYEAIRNACLHSGGYNLQVVLVYDKDLTIGVTDDGRGIDPEIAAHGRQGHYGILGMRQRASRIGATLDISTSPGGGTHTRLSVPGRSIFIDDNVLHR